MLKAEAANLVELAWALGNDKLQKGWWPYCRAELERIDKELPGTMAGALAALKAKREQRT
jgi:hypothetical protein